MGKSSGRRSQRRPDRQTERRREYDRTLLAQQAARIISDHGITDYRAAKSKAALALGLSEYGALPSNREIEAALAEHNRIFRPDSHAQLLEYLRETAVEMMIELDPFRPRLVGGVLSGNITRHSNIGMHLFADSPEAVSLRLDACGINYRVRQRRHSVRRGVIETFAGFDVTATDDVTVEASVFPERRQAHAPLSPVDGRPMRRARLQDVRALLNA